MKKKNLNISLYFSIIMSSYINITRTECYWAYYRIQNDILHEEEEVKTRKLVHHLQKWQYTVSSTHCMVHLKMLVYLICERSYYISSGISMVQGSMMMNKAYLASIAIGSISFIFYHVPFSCKGCSHYAAIKVRVQGERTPINLSCDWLKWFMKVILLGL